MPNAIVRASARPMPETNRRAVLGAVLAAGAMGVPALAMARPAAALSPLDNRVLNLWRRRRRLVAIRERFSADEEAAEAKLPAWAQHGPKYVRPAGRHPIHEAMNDRVGWPEVADLASQPLDVAGRILARPQVEDFYERFKERSMKGDGRRAATEELMRSLVAHEERLIAQRAEMERVGLNQAEERCERAYNVCANLEAKLKEHIEASVLALAGAMIIRITLDDEEDTSTIPMFRASLAAIRPALIDVIAEDADRVLAETVEEKPTII